MVISSSFSYDELQDCIVQTSNGKWKNDTKQDMKAGRAKTPMATEMMQKLKANLPKSRLKWGKGFKISSKNIIG
jgi:hypothetical protein